MYIISQAPASASVTSSGAATAAFTVIAGEPGAGTQTNLNAPGSNKLNGQPFTVRANGYTLYGAGTYTASTIQLLLCAANTASFAVATANAIVSMTAFVAISYTAATATAVPWEIEAEVTGDNVSARLSGVGQGYQGTSANVATTIAIARAIITNPITTANMATEPPVQFAVAVVSGGAQPVAPVSTLTQLLLEA